jgi:hypothetical protein
MKFKNKFNRVFNLISGLVLGIACFIGAYLAFRNGAAEISSLEIATGKIIERGTTPNEMNVSGLGFVSRTIFYFRIEGIDQLFAFYRTDQTYDRFFSLLQVDSIVTVYYQPSPRLNKPNLETFQVEKGGAVIISKEGFQARERLAGWIAIFGGVLLVGLTLNNDRKYWKKAV